MPSAFHQRLDTLTTAIAEMCTLASRAMQDATHALLHADAALAERVIAEHDEIMCNAGYAEKDAIALLALHAPLAGDLRTVVASLKNVAEADRMGVLALHVAEIVRRRHPAHAIPEEVNLLGRNGPHRCRSRQQRHRRCAVWRSTQGRPIAPR
jgi:phosphate transport system protein